MRLFLAIFLAILFTGCATFRKPQKGISAPTVAKQEQKDASIVSAADQIDVLAAPTEVALPVKEQTDAIRAAVKEAPAADVAGLVRSIEARAAKAEERAAKAEDRGTLAIKTAIFGLSTLVTMAGVALVFMGAQIGFAGPRMGLSVASAGLSGIGIGIAYDWATKHPWIVGVSLGFIVLAIGIAIANHLNSKS